MVCSKPTLKRYHHSTSKFTHIEIHRWRGRLFCICLAVKICDLWVFHKPRCEFSSKNHLTLVAAHQMFCPNGYRTKLQTPNLSTGGFFGGKFLPSESPPTVQPSLLFQGFQSRHQSSRRNAWLQVEQHPVGWKASQNLCSVQLQPTIIQKKKRVTIFQIGTSNGHLPQFLWMSRLWMAFILAIAQVSQEEWSSQAFQAKKKKKQVVPGGNQQEKKCILKKPQGSRFLWHSDAIQRGVFHCFFFTCKRVNMKNSWIFNHQELQQKQSWGYINFLPNQRLDRLLSFSPNSSLIWWFLIVVTL